MFLKALALTGLLSILLLAGVVAGTSRAQEPGSTLAISTLDKGSTTVIGGSTVTVPPSVTVIEEVPPPDMSLSEFKERRRPKWANINRYRDLQCLAGDVHPRYLAREIKPWLRLENLRYAVKRLRYRISRDTHCLTSDIRHEAGGPGHWNVPSNLGSWLCIHNGEGSWSDPNPTYYGGLQMDYSFMATYGPILLRVKGTADHWDWHEQVWVAERARRMGRGYYPWPLTARHCGLI